MGIEYTAGGIAAADIAPVDIVAGFVDSANILFVDVGQTASTETGSRGQPYQTIMAAVNAIIAAGNNDADVAYIVKVAPGTYVEKIDLDGLLLKNVSFIAEEPESVFISPGAGNALETDANNANLKHLYFRNFNFTKPVSLVGADNGTEFLRTGCIFDGCSISKQEATALTVTNANRVTWKNGSIYILDTIAISNVALFTLGENFKDEIGDPGAPGDTTIEANTGNNVPYDMQAAHDGDDLVEFRAVESFVQRKEPTFTTTGGKIRVTIRWSHFGNSYGSMSFTTDEMLSAYYSTFYGNITCGAGSTLRWYNSFCRGTFNADSCTNKRFYTDTPDIMESKYILNVDMNAVSPTDGANGSARHPYKTIMAAVNAVIAAQDNSDTVPYHIKIAPGTYEEKITLESAYLYNIGFEALGSGRGRVVVVPSGGTALQSKASNDNLHRLSFKGMRFSKKIDMLGEKDNTLFLQDKCLFDDCEFYDKDYSITIVTANHVEWHNGRIHVLADIVLTNLAGFTISGDLYADIFELVGEPGSTTCVVDVSGVNAPYDLKDENGGGDQMEIRFEHCFSQRDEVTLTETDGKFMYRCRWAWTGLNFSGLSIPANSSLYIDHGVLNSAVTLASGCTVLYYDAVIVAGETDNGATRHVYNNIES